MIEELDKSAPSGRYNDIFEKYYKDKYCEQIEWITDIAYQFLFPKKFYERNRSKLEAAGAGIDVDELGEDYLDPEYGIEPVVSPIHVERVSRAYFIDVIRYKEYHYNPSQDNLDYDQYAESIHSGERMAAIGPDRICAFLLKWIVKGQPIQVEISKEATIKDKRVNSRVWYLNSYLAVHVVFESLGIDWSKVDKDFIGNFLHHLRFRNIEDRSFFLTFRLLSHMENWKYEPKLVGDSE